VSKKVQLRIQAEKVSEQAVEVAENSTYEDLLGLLNINPETVLVFKEGNSVPLDGIVNSEKLTILKVVAGA